MKMIATEARWEVQVSASWKTPPRTPEATRVRAPAQNWKMWSWARWMAGPTGWTSTRMSV